MEEMLEKIKEIVEGKGKRDEKLNEICKLLSKIPYYNWVGFYRVCNGKLVLTAFVGEETEHKTIPVGKGICGMAVKQGKTIVVQDVSKEKNYIACSPKVKAEIVVPIFKEGKIVAEIDIDSHAKAPFSKDDKEFLEKVAKIISKIF